VIVTCEQCETQFQLDDAKVPETGIRVRCSRCKHAFFVESLHRSDTERADDLAREALAQDSAAASRSRDSNASGLEDGESDWQFNEEIDRVQALDDGSDGLAAAQEAVDDLLGGSVSESADPVTDPDPSIDPDGSGPDPSVEPDGSDLDPSIEPDGSDLDDRDDPDSPGPDGGVDLGGSNLDGGVDPGGSDLYGSVDLGDSDLDGSIDLGDSDPDGGVDLGGSDLDLVAPGPPMEDDAGSGLDLSTESAEDVNAVPIDGGVAPEGSPQPVEPAPAKVSPETSAAPDAAKVSDDHLTELGSPADWELLTDDAAPPSSASGTPIGHLAPPIPEEAELPWEAASPVHRGADGGAFDMDSQAVPSAAWISRVRGGVGWALVGLLCVYAGAIGLWPRLSASEPVLSAQPVAGLAAEAVRGRWIENAVAGPIYVVSGELRAGSSALAPTGSLLRIRLLDADGAPIAAESAAVGPLVPAGQLRQWDLRDLRQLQEAAAIRLAWDPLASGERRPFHAILGPLPPSATAFEFQVTAAASPAPEPDAGEEIPYPAPDLAAEAAIESEPAPGDLRRGSLRLP
jgi:predicted Zn finger-like uncharacterized protein